MANTPSGKAAAEAKAPTDTATQVSKTEQQVAPKSAASGPPEDHGVAESGDASAGRHESSDDQSADQSDAAPSAASPGAESRAAAEPAESSSGRGAGLHHR